MRLSRLVPAACGIVVLAVAGCSPEASPGPSPNASASAATASTSSAPKVANPLNTSKIESDPCSGLTEAQLAPYIGTIRKNGGKETDDKGESCMWYPTDGHNPSIALDVFPKLGGVSGLYDSGSLFPFFERAGTVGGYPATHESQGKNGPQTGDCQTNVAVSETVVLGVYVNSGMSSWPHYNDACTASDQLVTVVINNLKAGGVS